MRNPIAWLLGGDRPRALDADGNADHAAVDALPDGDALKPGTHRWFGF